MCIKLTDLFYKNDECLQWLPMVQVESGVAGDRVLATMLLSVLVEAAGEQVAPQLKEFLQLARKTITDTEMEVCFYTVVTLSRLVARAGCEEVRCAVITPSQLNFGNLFP